MRKTKYYCDICGKECDDTKFIIPNMIDVEARGGVANVLLWKGYRKDNSEMNICSECQDIISNFMYALKREKNKIKE